MPIKKQWLSLEEFEKIQGGSWTPSAHTHVKADITDFVHAASHHVAGADLLAFASITGFSTYLDQAVKQASNPIFNSVKFPMTEYDWAAQRHTVAPPMSLKLFDVYTDKASSPTTSYGTLYEIYGRTTHTESQFFFDGSSRRVFYRGAWYLSDFSAWKEFVFGGDSPTFVTVKLTALTDGYVPYHVSDAAGLANSPIRINGANVGIGKVPTCELDVNGTIKATDFLLAAGVRPNIGWLSDVNVDEFEDGETLLYDADTGMLVDAWGVEYDNPRLVWKIYTEFMGYSVDASPPWTAGTIAGGTMAGIAGLANHPGIIKFRSGVTVDSGYRFVIENDAILFAGKESTELIFQAKRNVDVRIKFGFIDTIGAGDPTDGIWLDALNGNLYGKMASNGNIGTTGTFFTLALNTWYRMKISISNANVATYSIYTCADDTIRWTGALVASPPIAGVTGHGIIATHSGEAAYDLIWLDMMTASRAGAWDR